MTLSIKAPVGATRRSTAGKPVRNAPADVELVQLMLVANGRSVPVDGKCSPAVVAAIRAFQKARLGMKAPDGIVDPGGRTWKAGLSRLQAKIAADQKALGELILVTEGGREKLVARAEFERQQQRILQKIQHKARAMHADAEYWFKFAMDAERSMAGLDTFMNQVAEFTCRWVNAKTKPPFDEISAARLEAAVLLAMAGRSGPDWARLSAQDAKATRAYNKAVKAFRRFIAERIGTAGGIVGKLETVREVSFAAVEAYATAKLVAKGTPPGRAHAMAAAGTEALKQGAGLLGEHLAGNKVTWGDAGAAAVEIAFSGVAGYAGGKLSSGLSRRLTGKLATWLMGKAPGGVSRKAIEILVTKLIASPVGQEMIASGVKEAIGLFKISVAKGRLPKKSEIEDAILKTCLAGLLKISPGKALKTFLERIPGEAGRHLNERVIPRIAESVRLDLIARHGREVVEGNRLFSSDAYAKVLEARRDKIVEIYVLRAATGSSGGEGQAALDAHGRKALERDAALVGEIERMIRAEAETRLRRLEGAR